MIAKDTWDDFSGALFLGLAMGARCAVAALKVRECYEISQCGDVKGALLSVPCHSRPRRRHRHPRGATLQEPVQHIYTGAFMFELDHQVS